MPVASPFRLGRPIAALAPGAALALALSLAFAGAAGACSCLPPSPDAAAVLRETPVIFWGRAVAVAEAPPLRTYTVELWAGNAPLPAKVTVKTLNHTAMCGVELGIGAVALIAGVEKDGAVWTNLCTQYAVETHRAAIEALLKECRPFQPCPAR
jgi:hypothetical protein